MTDATITFEEASPDDLPALLAVQQEAFTRTARQFGIPLDRMTPANEPLETLRALQNDGMRFWVARIGSTVVGTVRARTAPDGTVEIGRLAVATGYTRRGIARALMSALESAFPPPVRFALFTGREASGPLALYTSMGYRVVDAAPSDPVLVWLDKRVG